MNEKVILLGEGHLFNRLQDLVNDESTDLYHGRGFDGSPPYDHKDPVILGVSERFDDDFFRDCMEKSQQQNIPFLPVYMENHLTFIGPLYLPHLTGCIFCADERRRTVMGKEKADHLVSVRGNSGVNWPSSFLTGLEAVVQSYWNNPSLLKDHVYVYDLNGSQGELHSYTPYPNCLECKEQPVSPEKLTFKTLTKENKTDTRVKNPLLTPDYLKKSLYDYRFGVIAHIFRVTNSETVPFYVAELPMKFSNNRENGIGRTFSFEDSEKIAYLEALERYAGMTPIGKPDPIRGSYEELKDEAVNPRELILHDNQGEDIGLTQYQPYKDYNWVRGYSFKHDDMILVPEQAVYYGLNHVYENFKEEKFLDESSNGCALGNSLEEAALYGLFELIERDAFLMSWYGKLPLEEIDSESIDDDHIQYLINGMRAQGYEPHLFNCTNDFRLPVVWVTAVNQSDGLKTYSAAGANLNPMKAITGALVEVATSISVYKDKLPEQRDKALELLEDYSKVKFVEDHILLYSIDEAFHHFDFLFHNQPPKSVEHTFMNWYESFEYSNNLTEDLKYLTDHIVDTMGLDVIVVDQTPPELKEFDLTAVKVIVPGALTMTFGYSMTRTDVPRLYHAPYQLGYWTRPKIPGELQMVPHPFP